METDDQITKCEQFTDIAIEVNRKITELKGIARTLENAEAVNALYEAVADLEVAANKITQQKTSG